MIFLKIIFIYIFLLWFILRSNSQMGTSQRNRRRSLFGDSSSKKGNKWCYFRKKLPKKEIGLQILRKKWVFSFISFLSNEEIETDRFPFYSKKRKANHTVFLRIPFRGICGSFGGELFSVSPRKKVLFHEPKVKIPTISL